MEILKQGQLFAEAALFGAFLMLLYDGLRILRRVRRHGIVAVALEDLLFWLFCALGMFGFMYRQNDGVIRGFLILGAAVGMIAYCVLASRHVVRAGSVWLRRILRLTTRFFRFLCTPFRRICGFLRKKTDRSRSFVKKFCKNRKKQLKKLGKAVRIALSRL